MHEEYMKYMECMKYMINALSTWRVHGVHGECMNSTWRVHGVHGECMKYIKSTWRVHGVHGECMNSTWRVHGECMKYMESA